MSASTTCEMTLNTWRYINILVCRQICTLAYLPWPCRTLCVCVCMRACMRARARACVRACVCVFVCVRIVRTGQILAKIKNVSKDVYRR